MGNLSPTLAVCKKPSQRPSAYWTASRAKCGRGRRRHNPGNQARAARSRVRRHPCRSNSGPAAGRSLREATPARGRKTGSPSSARRPYRMGRWPGRKIARSCRCRHFRALLLTSPARRGPSLAALPASVRTPRRVIFRAPFSDPLLPLLAFRFSFGDNATKIASANSY